MASDHFSPYHFEVSFLSLATNFKSATPIFAVQYSIWAVIYVITKSKKKKKKKEC